MHSSVLVFTNHNTKYTEKTSAKLSSENLSLAVLKGKTIIYRGSDSNQILLKIQYSKKKKKRKGIPVFFNGLVIWTDVVNSHSKTKISTKKEKATRRKERMFMH